MLKNGRTSHSIASKDNTSPTVLAGDILVVFGSRVKMERQRQGMTIEQLAERSGLSDDTIKRIENNRRSNNRNGKEIKKISPRLDVAYSISCALGVPMQTLLSME